MSGHGHVTPNANGAKARCGGPAICSECALEQAGKNGSDAIEKLDRWAAEIGGFREMIIPMPTDWHEAYLLVVGKYIELAERYTALAERHLKAQEGK